MRARVDLLPHASGLADEDAQSAGVARGAVLLTTAAPKLARQIFCRPAAPLLVKRTTSDVSQGNDVVTLTKSQLAARH